MIQTETVDQKVVVFRVGKEEYAVTITAVKEVVPWIQPTPVPEAPPVVEGVVNLRGDVFPVVDLGRLFRKARAKSDDEARIMVMEVGGTQAGFVVDAVTEVCTMTPGALSPASPVLRQSGATSAHASMVAGILKLGEGRLVVLVDPVTILECTQEATV